MTKALRIDALPKHSAFVARLILASATLMVLGLPVVQAQTATDNNARPSERKSVSAQLVGGWRLVSRESRLSNGEPIHDPGLASTPMGVLIYDASGHVAAQLSRRDRTVAMVGEECQSATQIKGTPDTAQTVLGYDAYFGTYKVNEKDGIVTHHLDAALWPGDVGKDIDRSFIISGDRLTITFNTTTKDGTKVTRTLVWERMK